MSALTKTDDLFFNSDTGLDREETERFVTEGLANADGGELFLEYSEGESFRRSQQRTSSSGSPGSYGFGLRYIANGAFGYASNNELSRPALEEALGNATKVNLNGSAGKMNLPPAPAQQNLLYGETSPLEEFSRQEKVDLLKKIDDYVRAKDPRVKQVNVALGGSFQAVQIIRADGERIADLRPMVYCQIQTVLEENGRVEQGHHSFGGRHSYADIFNEQNWKAAADDAIRQADVNMHAEPPPAGKMTVVLGPGLPGVMIHEAVGHGLEGDFNYKRISAFSAPKSNPNPLGRIGQQVASPEVTVIDDGTWPGRSGSINIDDEGAPGKHNVLIENGILKGYMHDLISAQKMGVAPTGNGRRESYEHCVMPRMTNTYIANGTHTPEEIIQSVEHGIYAAAFGGGSVEIESGNFNFEMTEAYLIKNGRILWDRPVKAATMIGNGPRAMLSQVVMVGNDTDLDGGTGRCGKDGQNIPVGVGTPTLRLDNVVVGGMAGP